MDLEQARRIAEEPGVAAAAADELLGSLRRVPTSEEIRLLVKALRAVSSELAGAAGRALEREVRAELDAVGDAVADLDEVLPELDALDAERDAEQADREAPTTREAG